MPKLLLEPKGSQKVAVSDEFVKIKVQKLQAGFKRIKVPGEKDIGHGEFFLLLDITALKEDIYIPISIASGKKTTGFIYQIEGTGEGKIYETELSARGEGVTKITLGTLLYAKVPVGVTANFRLFIETKGAISKEYRVNINRLNYKLDPSDARYKKLDLKINTKAVNFY